MQCILCLKTPKKSIDIFGEHGIRLEIKTIITKHFWIQPSEDHINLNLVCCPCWKSLQSFHKFYESIEIAHCSLGEIKRDYDDNLHKEANSIDYRFDENNVLYPGIKNEYKNESNAKDNVSYPQEDEIKSDQADFYTDNHFDSELLPNLTKELKEEEEENEERTDVESEMKSVETSKNRADVEIHIKEGKWLATCFGEETTTNSIKHEELDKFIKLNIELTCEMCRIPMKDFSTLQAHFKEAHTIKPFVTCCEKKIELRCRLVDHILLHKLPNYFTCVICSKVLSCRLNLRKHMTVHDKKQIYSCDKCEKTFYRKDVLNRHVLDIHTLGRSFKCVECDKLFASKCSLYTHIYGVHKGRYKKICEQCGKVSCDQETFFRHQLIHTNQPKPLFDCPKCSIKLSSKHGLRHHIKHQHPNAADNREHVCNVCGTISKTEVGLKRHIKFMHVYKRDHKCTMCDKAFKRAQTLKEHMTTHTGEVLYTCPHCPKTFNSNANMHSHRKKMHRKEWEENRRHPHMGATTNATETEENNQ